MLPRYTIITKARVYESEIEDITKEIEEKREILHLDNEENYICHFFDSNFHDEADEYIAIDDAIQMLAIKDGYDMVIFEGYGFGFVAYYNGKENGFAILDAQKGVIAMYRQYENPRELEKELEELKAEMESMDLDDLDLDDLMFYHERKEELEERINFAWQDEEFEEDYAREAYRLGELTEEEYYNGL